MASGLKLFFKMGGFERLSFCPALGSFLWGKQPPQQAHRKQYKVEGKRENQECINPADVYSQPAQRFNHYS